MASDAYGLDNIYNIDLHRPKRDVLEQAILCLVDGQAVIFPTDTVYGIGVAVKEDSTPDLLFEIKKRDRSQAIPWLMANVMDLFVYGSNIRDYCERMAESLWPGPLTLVVNASDNVPPAFRSGDGTIALRVPDSTVTLDLIESLGSPIATTSANIHGRGAVANGDDLDPEVMRLVPMVLNGGEIVGGLPSTIVSCTGDIPKVLRVGSITEEQIMSFVE